MKTRKATARTVSILLTICLSGLVIMPSLAFCSQKCCMGSSMPAPGHGDVLSMDQPRCCCCGNEANSCNMQQDWSYEVADIIPLTSQRPEIPSPAATSIVTTLKDIPFGAAYVFRGTENTSGAGQPIPIFLVNHSFLC